MRAEKPASWVVTVVWLILIALAVITLSAILLVYVPGHKRTFDEFGLQLPQVTRLVLHLSAFFQASWLILVPALMIVCCGLPLVIRHVARARTLGNVFAVVFLVLLLLANGLVMYAVNAPMAALLRGLSK
jgi:type II secretory pathway component PulF